MRDDRIAFLLLFCGMILVRRHRATMKETISMLPLYGRVRRLGDELIEATGPGQEGEAGTSHRT